MHNAIGEEGNWKPPHKIHFPRKKSPVSGFCYARNRVCKAVIFSKIINVSWTEFFEEAMRFQKMELPVPGADYCKSELPNLVDRVP